MKGSFRTFCSFLPKILTSEESISLYCKFLYQDGVLEERAIIALTKFETMLFKEQLISQIRCMNLPKEPAQASIVLFLRDLIGFCESSDCIGDFLKILKASRIKDQKSDMSDDTIYQLPTSIIGKLVLSSFMHETADYPKHTASVSKTYHCHHA